MQVADAGVAPDQLHADLDRVRPVEFLRGPQVRPRRLQPVYRPRGHPAELRQVQRRQHLPLAQTHKAATKIR